MPRHAASMLLALASATSAPAFALDLRVGTGAGCTHATLQAALDALEGQTGLHTVRINKGGYLVADGMVYAPTVNQTGVFLEGGYDSCTAPAPTGDVTVDANRAVFNGAGGAQRSVLDLRLFGRVGTFQMRRIVLTGGDATALSAGSDEFESGGGLIVRGGASVLLGLGASVRGNAAINGGGVALAGSRVNVAGSVARVDFFIDDGAEIISNTATRRGGGIYCGGGNPAPDSSPDGNRHGVIVFRDGVLGFNAAAEGGAFYCRGSVQGGGGLQPAPRDGRAAWIVGNQGGATGLGCAAGDGTLDMSVPVDFASGYRLIGAPANGTGMVAVTSNRAGGNAGMCLFGSYDLGSFDTPAATSRFVLRNLYVSDQTGGGVLGLRLGAELELVVAPSGSATACSFFNPTPCVRLTGNEPDGSGSSTTNGRLLLADDGASMLLARAQIDGNRGRPDLIVAADGGQVQLAGTILDGNQVVVGVATPTDSAALFEATRGGVVSLVHTTAVMRTPLTQFFRINDGVVNGSVEVRASILASTVVPPPANVGGSAPASRLTRQWCGFFQTTGDFATHTVQNDPTLGTFVTLPAAAFDLDPATSAPRSAGLIDACSQTAASVDFYGRPFTVLLEPGSPVRADIGAVEAQPIPAVDPIFANGFEPVP